MAWTDERLDDLSARMDAGFERVDRDIRELRLEMREIFTGIRCELQSSRTTLLRIGGGLMIGLVGIIAALLANGS